MCILGVVIGENRWSCHAYCLMPNHYHLLLETPEGNLSPGMRKLNGVYSRKYNSKISRSGHVFEGRYKSLIVDTDAYFLEILRYIVLNPVRSGLVTDPSAWPWSSYAATAGQAPEQRMLVTDFTLSLFGESTDRAREVYRHFVSQGVGGSVSAGNEGGITGQGALSSAAAVGGEGLARKHKDGRRSPLPCIFGDNPDVKKINEGIREAYFKQGYTLQEIGEHLGVHLSTVGRKVKSPVQIEEPAKRSA